MTKSTGSLGTNVLLRMLLNDVPEQHTAAKRLIMGHTNNQFAIADTAIIELVITLDKYNGFSRPQIAEAVDGPMKLKEVKCNEALYEKALPLFINHSGLSFGDCCLVTYAQLSEAEPLWTFDKKLANQASSTKLVSS